MRGIKLAPLQMDQRLPKDEAVTVEFTPIGSEHSRFSVQSSAQWSLVRRIAQRQASVVVLRQKMGRGLARPHEGRNRQPSFRG